MSNEGTIAQNCVDYYDNYLSEHVVRLFDSVDRGFLWIFPIFSPVLIYFSLSSSYFTNVLLFSLLLGIILVKLWVVLETAELKSEKNVPVRVSGTANGRKEPVSTSSPFNQHSKQIGLGSFSSKRSSVDSESIVSSSWSSSYTQRNDLDDNSTINDEYNTINNAEPMNSREWSLVTSPGFPTRAVKRASIHENVGGWNKSPFQYSPNRGLQLGQIPYGSKWKGNLSPTSLRFSSPLYGPTADLCKRQSITGYVPIKPLDPDRSYTGYLDFRSRGIDDDFAKPVSLGGTPTHALVSNSPNQLLASANNILDTRRTFSPSVSSLTNAITSSSPSMSSIPTSAPSSILEALANRKRKDDVLALAEPGKRTSTSPTLGRTSIGTDDTPKSIKRLRFHPNGGSNTVLSPYQMVSLPDLRINEDEPMMTTESILEQMNQTEKRYLPDDDTSNSSRPIMKKARSTNGTRAKTPVSGASQIRKRKHSFGVGVEDEALEKNPRFCTCIECYQEAAGVRLSNDAAVPIKRVSISIPSKDVADANSRKPSNASQPLRKLVDKASETDPVEPFNLRFEDFNQFGKAEKLPARVITKSDIRSDNMLRAKRLQIMLELSTSKASAKAKKNSALSMSKDVPSTTDQPSVDGFKTSNTLPPTTTTNASFGSAAPAPQSDTTTSTSLPFGQKSAEESSVQSSTPAPSLFQFEQNTSNSAQINTSAPSLSQFGQSQGTQSPQSSGQGGFNFNTTFGSARVAAPLEGGTSQTPVLPFGGSPSQIMLESSTSKAAAKATKNSVLSMSEDVPDPDTKDQPSVVDGFKTSNTLPPTTTTNATLGSNAPAPQISTTNTTTSSSSLFPFSQKSAEEKESSVQSSTPSPSLFQFGQNTSTSAQSNTSTPSLFQYGQGTQSPQSSGQGGITFNTTFGSTGAPLGGGTSQTPIFPFGASPSQIMLDSSTSKSAAKANKNSILSMSKDVPDTINQPSVLDGFKTSNTSRPTTTTNATFGANAPAPQSNTTTSSSSLFPFSQKSAEQSSVQSSTPAPSLFQFGQNTSNSAQSNTSTSSLFQFGQGSQSSGQGGITFNTTFGSAGAPLGGFKTSNTLPPTTRTNANFGSDAPAPQSNTTTSSLFPFGQKSAEQSSVQSSSPAPSLFQFGQNTSNSAQSNTSASSLFQFGQGTQSPQSSGQGGFTFNTTFGSAGAPLGGGTSQTPVLGFGGSPSPAFGTPSPNPSSIFSLGNSPGSPAAAGRRRATARRKFR